MRDKGLINEYQDEFLNINNTFQINSSHENKNEFFDDGDKCNPNNVLDAPECRQLDAIHWILVASSICIILIFILWCCYGWCCCCCTFGFCQVEERIHTIQDFIAHYPPGHVVKKGYLYQYDPTPKEIILYEELTNSFLDL